MDEFYTRVSNATKQTLYQFMKDQNISLLNYRFDYFFQFCIQINNIQVLPHHFSSHKIEGLTVVDELGISFSYERDNPKVKQNFTLCHELGHFMLKHDGNYFAESIDNQENLLEREANIFSAVVLMPDIVLLSKIYYINQVKQRVSKVGFTTSQEYPDLLNQDNWKVIKASSVNLKTWLVYNKGKSIAYVWDKDKFSDEEAKKKAELQLLLM